ncbi:MAG: efflux RND transporter permease subunit, partial [Calditrichaceae bacterium]|nr:efflux RND transporter permease subunit [Calditrichaceae bacterium]
MKIAQVSIKRGVTFFMIYLIAVGFGLFSLNRLNLDLYPDMEFPVIAIFTQYTGVGPYDIETVITRPIEETVSAVENINKVTSSSMQGFSVVMLEFDWGTDMDQAEIDVRNNLEFLRDALPDDISQPIVMSFNPSQQPILYLSVSSELHGQAELRRISEQEVEPRIERIAGVAGSFTSGGMRREIKVLANPSRLKAHNVSIQQLVAALQMNNLQVPSGWIENKRQEFTLQTVGEYSNIEQIENTAVTAAGSGVVRIKDVATVIDGFAKQRQRVWNNDRPAVMLMVQKQSDANTVSVCREVINNLPAIESTLPEGVKIETLMDFSVFINKSMSNLGNTALQAVALTLLVLLFFLRNLRSSLIVAVSIPVSMIVTFAVMDQAGLTLNVISMAGLALAVGMLVDNSIVVLENIFRFHEQGESARDAANNGASEVGMAITASTLTTLAVFIPVLFVPGIAGELFSDMVVTIVFSLSVSLLVALSLIPLMASRFLMMTKRVKKENIFARWGNHINHWLENLQNVYSIALDWALDHRKTVVLSVFVLFLFSVITIYMMGGEFLPENDMGYISVAVDRSPGTSLEAMDESMHKVNQIIMDNTPETEIVYTSFGQGEGIAALFSSRGSSEGDIMIKLVGLSERDRSMFEIQDALREKFKNLPDVDVRFEDRGQTAMMGNAADIVIQVFGHDLDISEALAGQIAEKAKTIEGIVEVETSFRQAAPELQINIDRQRVADLGLSTTQIGQTVSTSILGTVATQYREKGDEFDIRVQLDEESRTSKEDVDNILIMTPFGKQIPLRAIADVVYAEAPKEIDREDQERVVSVNISISGRTLSEVTDDVENAIRQVSMPTDFRTEIGGTAEEQQESFMYLGIAFFVAIFLTYMVMASQFESFLDPFIIIFTIPMSFIGVAFGLIVTGTSLSVMALVGIVMLVGIVVNNGIVLVDYIN